MQNSDHRIALGFAAGFFPCWFPTMGIDIVIAIALSRLFSANIAAAVIAASTGSVLWPLLFFINFKVGSFLREMFSGFFPEKIGSMVMTPIPGWNHTVLADFFSHIGNLGFNFLIGSVFNSIVSVFAVYGVSRLLMSRYRQPLLHKMKISVKHRRKQCERSRSL